MAFNEFQLEELKKIEGFGKGFEAGEKTAAGAMGDIALIMIPGMGTIKLARTGGKLTKSAMDFVKRAKKMYPNAKVNPTPTAAQVSNAKPISGVTLKKPADVAVSALKPRPRATAPGGKPTTAAAPKPKVRVPAGTAAKPAPKATAPKPSAKPAAKPKPQAKPKSKVGDKPQRAAAALAAVTALAGAELESRKRKEAEAAKKKPIKVTQDRSAKQSEAAAKPKPKRKPIKVTQDRSAKQSEAAAKGKRKPIKVTQDRSAKQSEAAAKGKPTVKSRPKPVTAGKNVGFGPKGNIFPKDAADRRRLMAKYGGTGSAAAKAAADGKQGNLKKKK
jgi:hypothetical protein